MSGFGFNAGGIGTAFSDLGGAVSDLFGSEGAKAEAKGYGEAETLANQDAVLSLESAKIQQYQQSRQASMAMGEEKSAMAGNNLAGGSGADILRSSAQQAALGSSLLGLQGQIQSQGFKQQAAALQGEQEAAKKAASGGLFGAITSGIGAIASIL